MGHRTEFLRADLVMSLSSAANLDPDVGLEEASRSSEEKRGGKFKMESEDVNSKD